jgi:hypothetical protein
VPASDTDSFLKGDYLYDVQITDANGDVWTSDSGKVKVTEDVTITVP